VSNLNEYPKALYSPQGAFRVVHDKDAEDAQLVEWGVEPERDVVDIPNMLQSRPLASNDGGSKPAAPKVVKPRIGRQKKTA
jgi:hypothetical protein